MREMTVEELKKNSQKLVTDVERDNVMLTRQGRPFALVFRLENYDREDFQYMTSAGFWEMIAERQRETKFVSMDEMRARLLEDERKEAPAKESNGNHGTKGQ